MSTKSRLAVGTVAALFASSILAGPAFSQAAAPTDVLELRLAVADPNVNPVTDSILKLADTMGYYAAHGLHVTVVPLEGTPQVVAAINAGDVDLGDIAVDATLRLVASNGVGIRGIVSSTLGPPYLIAAKDSIADVQGLVGHSFAVADVGSLDYNLTRAVLGSMDISPDGPNFVTIGAPAVRVQALAAGQVDATTVSFGTYLPISNTPGLHVILPPEDFFEAAPIQSKFVVALQTTLDAKHEAIQRFVDALVDISRHYDGDQAAWVADMRSVRDDLTAEQLGSTWQFLEGRWCVNGCLNTEYLQQTVDFIYANPDFADVPKLAATDVTDTTFVTQALTDLGAYEGGGVDARE